MRTFVAIELPDTLRAEIGDRMQRARQGLPSARWVDPSLLHLTLVFLGELDEAWVDPLGSELAMTFRRNRPFELKLRAAGTFPPRRPARVAWVGAEGGEALLDLQREVGATVKEVLRRPVEKRPFHPHVTLARCRHPWKRYAVERFEEGFRDFEASFPVSEGVLMASRLGPGGARYAPVRELPLAVA